MGNGRRRGAFAAIGAATALIVAGCVPSGPPDPDRIADEFDDAIEPAWSQQIEGSYGEPGIGADIVAVYAQDPETVLSLRVYDLASGDLLWEHAASPGGAWAAPLFDETNSVSRPYPIPSIQPTIVATGSGEDAHEVLVFFERDTNGDARVPCCASTSRRAGT